MKSSIINKLLLVSTSIVSGLLFSINTPLTLAQTVTTNKQSTKSHIRYSCINRNGTPATVADTRRGRIELVLWKSDYWKSSGFTPEFRCQEVSKRFQSHSDANNFQYISTGQVNRYPVICISDKNGKCQPDAVLITLEPNDNPQQVLKELFDLETRKRAGGINRPAIRGIEIKEVIDMDEFLTESPVMEQNITVSEPNPESDSINNNSSGGTVIENPFNNY